MFNSPVTAPCGHTFCRQCIHRWLANHNECPVDRSPLERSRLNPSLVVRNLVLRLAVVCPTCRGAEDELQQWEGSLEQWHAHMLRDHKQYVF